MEYIYRYYARIITVRTGVLLLVNPELCSVCCNIIELRRTPLMKKVKKKNYICVLSGELKINAREKSARMPAIYINDRLLSMMNCTEFTQPLLLLRYSVMHTISRDDIKALCILKRDRAQNQLLSWTAPWTFPRYLFSINAIVVVIPQCGAAVRNPVATVNQRQWKPDYISDGNESREERKVRDIRRVAKTHSFGAFHASSARNMNFKRINDTGLYLVLYLSVWTTFPHQPLE